MRFIDFLKSPVACCRVAVVEIRLFVIPIIFPFGVLISLLGLGSIVVFMTTIFALWSGIGDGLAALVIIQAESFAEASRQLVKYDHCLYHLVQIFTHYFHLLQGPSASRVGFQQC